MLLEINSAGLYYIVVEDQVPFDWVVGQELSTFLEALRVVFEVIS